MKRDRLIKRNFLHGHCRRGRRSSEWTTWQGMKKRCNNPHHKYYKYYGGRGIKVCKRWEVFKNFLLDMGQKPESSLTLDRKENDKDYSPWNCRWADRVEQNNNRRNAKEMRA